jgi:type VI secretion system ImpJ/VasE family protein
MAVTGHVHWHEGLFLQPHHLQWMQRQFLEQTWAERRLGFPYPYGVVEALPSADALANMVVQFDRLHVVMPSGLEVVVPDSADLPPLDIRQAFQTSSGGFTVSLGVPKWYPGRANTLSQDGHADYRTNRLYRVAEVESADENTGDNSQPLMVRRVNARLLLDGDDKTDLEHLPVLRVLQSTGEEKSLPRLDPEFIPPCLVMGGSPYLRELSRDIANLVEARRRELSNRMQRTGFSLDAIRGIQFAQLLRLRSLNRFAGRLPAIARAPGITPLDLYLELRELLGELAALQPAPDLFEVAPYDHDRPAVPFAELSRKVRHFLPPEDTGSVMKVDLVAAEKMLTADLNDAHLTKPNEYYLAVLSKQDTRDLVKLVEDADRFMVMSRRHVRATVWGVKLVEERNPPPQLPKPAGLTYFRMVPNENPHSQRMWQFIKDEKAVAVTWRGMESSDYKMAIFMTVPQVEAKTP